MDIPKDTNIERIITDATYIAERSNHPLAWHLVQQLQQLRAPLHTNVERQAVYDAVAALYCMPRAHNTAMLDDATYALIDTVHDYLEADAIVAEARACGYGAVETAIDQAHDYDSLDYALYCHHLNACDTLGEVFHSLRGDGRFDDARHAIDAGFNAAIAERGLTYNG
jgi:hypothetical protein